MATRAQILTARDTAGADYAAKAQAFVDAWVALAAYDQAMEAVGGGRSMPFGDHPKVLTHSVYLSRATRDAMVSPNVIAPAVKSQAESIIASWSGS